MIYSLSRFILSCFTLSVWKQWHVQTKSSESVHVLVRVNRFKQFWLPFPNIILPHMDDDSICSLVLHHNVPKFLVHIRDGCLSKAAVSCSPGTDVSNNRVTHYKSPGLGCALSWMPLSARHWAPVSSNVSCWLIRSKFCHILGFLIHIHQCFKSVLKMYRGL